MKTVKKLSLWLSMVGLLIGSSTSLSAEELQLRVSDPAEYLIDESEEVALSRSAAPAAISAEATILVLDRGGSYRVAAEGVNGWTCFTGRSWTGPARFMDGRKQWTKNHFNPKARGPQCFNPSASASVLERHKLATRLFFQGATTDEVDLAIGRALSSGEIPHPEVGAMSYMFSPHQYLGDRVGRFMPHVMLYQPYVSQEDFGAPNSLMSIPIVGEGGSAFATTVIMSAYWSDGTPVQEQ